MGASAIGTSIWVRRVFGIVSIDQVFINLQGAGTRGAGGFELVMQGVLYSLVSPAIIVYTLFWGFSRIRQLTQVPSKPWKPFVKAPFILSVLIVPVFGFTLLGSTVSFGEYVQSIRTSQQLADYYVVPTGDFLTPDAAENPRNLVIIYLESVEDSLGSTDLFEIDMLEDLNYVTEGWASVPALLQYEGGGFTVSGIVSTLCGIPLRTGSVGAGDGNGMADFGESVEDYLPGATCLGDLLEKRGYAQVYMGGASTVFSGKGQFFKSHGYSEVLGLEEWEAAGETETRPAWGLSDRRLMELAKNKITELYEGDQPFNLTLLTVDSHPNEFVHDTCVVSTADATESIYRCSNKYVANFLLYMSEQGYLDNTDVVVMGDHLKPVGSEQPFHAQLKNLSDRTIYNRIWTTQVLDFAYPEIDQLSMYPTILEIVGYDLPAGRAGIGVSALYPLADKDTIRVLDREQYKDLIRSRSSNFYDSLW